MLALIENQFHESYSWCARCFMDARAALTCTKIFSFVLIFRELQKVQHRIIRFLEFLTFHFKAALISLSCRASRTTLFTRLSTGKTFVSSSKATKPQLVNFYSSRFSLLNFYFSSSSSLHVENRSEPVCTRNLNEQNFTHDARFYFTSKRIAKWMDNETCDYHKH